jgi:hypothetical protein
MRRAHPLLGALLSLLLRSSQGRRNLDSSAPIAVVEDIVWLVALSSFTLMASFGFAAAAAISSGDLRAFAIAVTFATLGVSALAATKLAFRLGAFSASIADDAFEREPARRYPVANDP